LRFPRPFSCSCSRRGGAVDGGRLRGEGVRGGGLDRSGKTGGGGRRIGGGPIVIVIPPWDSPARVGKGGGESGTRKPYLSSSSSVSFNVAVLVLSLLTSSAFSSSANSAIVSPRALAFLYVFFFLYVFLGTALGILIGIYINSLRRSALVISLDSCYEHSLGILGGRRGNTRCITYPIIQPVFKV
jgi:hypothetical protein